MMCNKGTLSPLSTALGLSEYMKMWGLRSRPWSDICIFQSNASNNGDVRHDRNSNTKVFMRIPIRSRMREREGIEDGEERKKQHFRFARIQLWDPFERFIYDSLWKVSCLEMERVVWCTRRIGCRAFSFSCRLQFSINGPEVISYRSFIISNFKLFWKPTHQRELREERAESQNMKRDATEISKIKFKRRCLLGSSWHLLLS